MSAAEISMRGLATVCGEREMSAEALAALQGCSVAAAERSLGDSRLLVTDLASEVDLGVAAAELCLARAGVAAGEIDGMICLGISGWEVSAPIAHYQHRLGIASLDVGCPLVTDCTTPVTALRLARSLLLENAALQRVLVIGASIFRDTTRTMLPLAEDRYALVYTDAAFAVLVERGPGIALLGFGGGTFSELRDHIERLWNATPEDRERMPSEVQVLHMSKDMHRTALRRCLAAAALGPQQIDHVVFAREAGVGIERSILRQMALDPERLFRVPRGPSHTTVADQLIALEGLVTGPGQPGQHVLMAGRTYGIMQCALVRIGAA